MGMGAKGEGGTLRARIRYALLTSLRVASRRMFSVV
jgi:hypothetical protein